MRRWDIFIQLAVASLLSLSLALLNSSQAYGACDISFEQESEIRRDYLAQIFSKLHVCPTNLADFRLLLKNDGLAFKTTMVANRGFHNPKFGSFSIFEMTSGNSVSTTMTVENGDFFFGHFTGTERNGDLTLAQTPSRNALLIELIAWDPIKHRFNFYELIGDGHQGRWFYRGDSLDIFLDIHFLHLRKDQEKKQFGNRLRCSGCHLSGGPIMKERAAPHNDWWSADRPLPFGKRRPDFALSQVMETLVNPSELAVAVQRGSEKLLARNSSQSKGPAPSLPELLRPLFCPMEINLESSPIPWSQAPTSIEIPSSFLLNPFLQPTGVPPIRVPAKKLIQALRETQSKFPEISSIDADHPWLTPVKAVSDLRAIENLIRSEIISLHFALAILSVDKGNPSLSNPRCNLMRFIPRESTFSWQRQFVANIWTGLTFAKPAEVDFLRQAIRNLTDAKYTVDELKREAAFFFERCRNAIESEPFGFVKLLGQVRQEVLESEISANPSGQILEPSFRVIFPTISPTPKAAHYFLSSNCEIYSY